MATTGLGGGAKVAVVGAGLTGAAFAVSLLHGARLKGRAVEVALYHGGGDEALPGGPALLTPECRTRLAALGYRVPPAWRTLDLRGVEVLSQGERALLPAPPNGLWVVDGAAHGLSGERMVAGGLRALAVSMGARLVHGRVHALEESPPEETAGGAVPGRVVRSLGRGERFDVVALATGRSDSLCPRLAGFRGAPTLHGVQARVRFALPRLEEAWARLVLHPLPRVQGLWLVPCGAGSVQALAFGEGTQPADLCEALMMANRDGLIPDGFEVSSLTLTHVPNGAGRHVVAPGLLGLGPLAMGHPLALGLSDSLRTSSRGALALLEGGPSERALERHYVRGLAEAAEELAAGAAALPWLERAGPRAPRAFASAVSKRPVLAPLAPCALGLSGLTPSRLFQRARVQGVLAKLGGWLQAGFRPLPASTPVLEPNLYYVVDDDDDTRGALTELLQARGAEVVAFADELALFAAVAQRPPTAIFLDVVLNWVDGLRLCEGLKAHPLTCATPVYVMSGLNRPHVRRRALDSGAAAFFAKPLEPELLWKVVRRPVYEADISA